MHVQKDGTTQKWLLAHTWMHRPKQMFGLYNCSCTCPHIQAHAHRYTSLSSSCSAPLAPLLPDSPFSPSQACTRCLQTVDTAMEDAARYGPAALQHGQGYRGAKYTLSALMHLFSVPAMAQVCLHGLAPFSRIAYITCTSLLCLLFIMVCGRHGGSTDVQRCLNTVLLDGSTQSQQGRPCEPDAAQRRERLHWPRAYAQAACVLATVLGSTSNAALDSMPRFTPDPVWLVVHALMQSASGRVWGGAAGGGGGSAGPLGGGSAGAAAGRPQPGPRGGGPPAEGRQRAHDEARVPGRPVRAPRRSCCLWKPCGLGGVLG